MIRPTIRDDTYNLEGISNSEYAENKATRIIAYCYVIYFCGAPIVGKSKSGKIVTLPSK